MKSAYPIRSVGDVLTLEYGKPLPESDRASDGDVPAYGANGVLCWSKRAFKTQASIIVGRKGSAGEVNLTEGAFWPTDVTYFVEHDGHTTDLRYLFHALKFLELPRLAKGVKPGINRNDVYALSVPVPPIIEQKRIVAILDGVFDGVDTAVANAEKNLANANKLFDSYLNLVLTFDDDNVQTRELATLCDQSRVITYGVIKLGEEVPGGVPCLRTSNVRWLKFETDGVKRIAPSLSSDYKRTILQGGEVLVNVRGTLGGVAAVDPTMVGWNVSREVAVVPSDENKINQSYLAYWIARKASQSWLTGVQKGVAYTGINIADLRELPVALPDPETQTRLVKQLYPVHVRIRKS